MTKRWFARMALAVAIPALSSCGGEGNGAPDGSLITISPPGATWKVTAGSCGGGDVNYHAFNVTIRNSNGVPLNNVDMYVTLDVSPNTSPLYQVVQLYDDPQWQGGTTVAPQNPKSVPYTTKTDAYGSKMLIVSVDLGGCTYKANLNVYSGAAFATAPISVSP